MPRRLVLKLDDAFSGEGNALLDISPLSYHPIETDDELVETIKLQLIDPCTRFQAESESWHSFAKKMESVGVLAELFLESSENDVRYYAC